MTQEHLLDVTDLAPPAPLEMALAALEMLPAGHYLRLLVKFDPVFLYPLLLVQGFAHESHKNTQENYEVLIWHKDDALAEQAVRRGKVDPPT